MSMVTRVCWSLKHNRMISWISIHEWYSIYRICTGRNTIMDGRSIIRGLEGLLELDFMSEKWANYICFPAEMLVWMQRYSRIDFFHNTAEGIHIYLDCSFFVSKELRGHSIDYFREEKDHQRIIRESSARKSHTLKAFRSRRHPPGNLQYAQSQNR